MPRRIYGCCSGTSRGLHLLYLERAEINSNGLIIQIRVPIPQKSLLQSPEFQAIPSRVLAELEKTTPRSACGRDGEAEIGRLQGRQATGVVTIPTTISQRPLRKFSFNQIRYDPVQPPGLHPARNDAKCACESAEGTPRKLDWCQKDYGTRQSRSDRRRSNAPIFWDPSAYLTHFAGGDDTPFLVYYHKDIILVMEVLDVKRVSWPEPGAKVSSSISYPKNSYSYFTSSLNNSKRARKSSLARLRVVRRAPSLYQ